MSDASEPASVPEYAGGKSKPNLADWKIVGTDERRTGTYFFLSISSKSGARSTVKARMDGSYLCLNRECIAANKAVWLPGKKDADACLHATFVRDYDRGRESEPTAAPPLSDADFPQDALEGLDDAEDATPDDDQPERREHTPPF